MTIRAGAGYRPVFENACVGADYPGTTLNLEGLHFREAMIRTAANVADLASNHGRIGRVANCSFESTQPLGPHLSSLTPLAGKDKATEIVNCWFPSRCIIYSVTNGRIEVKNSVLGSWTFAPRDVGQCTADFNRCYFRTHDAGSHTACIAAGPVDGGTDKQRNSDLRVNLRRSIVESYQHLVHANNPILWTGERNIYRIASTWSSGTSSYGLATWQAMKDVSEKGSVELDTLLADPASWRLQPDSPAAGAGADVSKVGR